MADIIKAVLTKKVLDNNGDVVSEVPIVPKTTSDMVIMDDGSTLDEALLNVKGYVTYQTEAAYLAAYAAGQVPADTLAIITTE